VLLRTRDELAAVIDANPMRAVAEQAPSRFLVAFLSAPPTRLDLDAKKYLPDEFRALGREIYASFPGGIGTSKLAMELLGPKRLGVTPTTRNWATVTKLLALADG
jgi:uncharacterized protein (DUF1697 family)